MATATTSYSSQVWGWHEKYLWNAEPKSFDMAAPTAMKSTSTASVITSASMVIYTHTDANNGIALTCTVKTKDGTKTLINQKLKINKADNDEKYTFSASGLNISGDSVFGSNASGYTVTLTFSNDYSAATTRSFSVNTGKNSMPLTLTYTPKCRISFSGTNVTAISATTYTEGDTVTTPTVGSDVTERIGYTLSGWTATEWDETGTPPSTVTPTAGHVDQTYYAYWTKTPYHVNVQTVNQSGDPITAPTGQTGDKTYYINNNMTCTAPSSDYIYDPTTTYVFWYWSLHNVNGGTIIGTYSSRDWTLGILNTTNIPEWFVDSTNTVIAKAHYQRVYDIELGLSGVDTKYDPTGAGQIGVNRLTVYNTSNTELGRVDGNTLRTGSAADRTVRVKTDAIQITATLDNDYTLDKLTPGNNVAYNASTGVYTLSSSTVQFVATVYRQHFYVWLHNGNTDHGDSVAYSAVKVYNLTHPNLPTRISPETVGNDTRIRIARGTPIRIDARDAATIDTEYAATNLSYYQGTPFTGNYYEILNTSALDGVVQDYEFGVTTSLVTYNITINETVDGHTSSSTATVNKSKSYTYTKSGSDAYTITSATVSIGNQTNTLNIVNNAVSYTIEHAVGNYTFNISMANNPNAYVSISTHWAHGGGTVEGDRSVLKSGFAGFVVKNIVANAEYQITSATYRWITNGVSGQSSPLTVGQGTSNTITYNGTMPTDQSVECVVEIAFRKNTIYRNGGSGAAPQRPQSLWYTPVGQAPQRVVAVYAQTESHPAPILLFGDVE